jgi:hypothetical protein
MSWYASRVKGKGLIDALRRTVARLDKDSSAAISPSTRDRLRQALNRRIAESEKAVDAPKAIIVARSHE